MTTLHALIFDLDGVLTDTASLHFRAWKRLFDTYLRDRSDGDFQPFTQEDYRRRVDGKPRHEGAESFLRSRGISLPRGEADDPPDAETVIGLGKKKNTYYRSLLEQEGATPFPDAVQFLRRARDSDLRCAIVTSSRNGAAVVASAGLGTASEFCVDGRDLDAQGLEGKPAPDLFLEAARRLEIDPATAAIFEDARSGIAAGRAGGFGLVVGVARNGGAEELREAGADLVVRSLDQLEPGDLTSRDGRR